MLALELSLAVAVALALALALAVAWPLALALTLVLVLRSVLVVVLGLFLSLAPVLAMPQELSEARQKQLNERFTRGARNSRYRYTPDTIVEVSMGRARRLTYEVVESEGNQLTIEIMRPSGQPRTEVLQVSGDTLIATDERGERRYRRMRSPRVTAEKESEKEIEESGSR